MSVNATKGWKYRVWVNTTGDDYNTIFDGGGGGWDEFGGTDNHIVFPSACEFTEVQDNILIPGTRGKRAYFDDQTSEGVRQVGGLLRMKFGRADLDYWLPAILGAAQASDVFKVADTLPYVHFLVDKGQDQAFTYRDCKIARAVFSGAAGGVVNLELAVVGKKEVLYVGSMDVGATHTPSAATKPLRFSEGVFTLDPAGTPKVLPFTSFRLTIDNGMEPMFYAGDDAATDLDEGMRSVVLEVPAAHSSVTAPLYDDGATGMAIRGKWTNGNMSTQFDVAKAKWPKRSAVMSSEEGNVPWNLVARAFRSEAGLSGVDDDIKFTNDPTP